jgi:predicted phosphodiesterase
MKIHLLSDIHIEREPYTLPPDLDFDVLVAAGDISDDPKQAIDFLASIGKPVVMVAGNHDYWSPDNEHLVDLHDRLIELEKLAEGTQVHVLEMESVIIDGVRFLGTTFWTDYARNSNLANYAFRCMRDFGLIGAKHWLSNPEYRMQFERDCKELELRPGREGYFHPALAYRWHQDAREWLTDELRQPSPAVDGWARTIVVTHHQPSYHCLLQAGEIQPSALDPHTWTPRLDYRWDQEGHHRIAAYASNCDHLLVSHQAQIDLWLCGHVHRAVDTAAGGVRIVSNPRGYYDGESYNFNPSLVIDLENQGGYLSALQPEIDESIDRLLPLLEDVKRLAPHTKHDDPAILTAVQEAINKRLNAFHDEGMAIGTRISGNLAYMSDDCRHGFTLPAPGCSARLPGPLPWSLEPIPGTRYRRPTIKKMIKVAEKFLAALRRVPQFPGRVAREVAKRAQWGVETAAAAGFAVTFEPIRVTHCSRHIRFRASREIVDDKEKGAALTKLLEDAANPSDKSHAPRQVFATLRSVEEVEESWPW